MKNINLLLVEDNEGDILLTIEAFEDAKIVNHISVARDGEQAINLLASCLKESSITLPDLVLLDVNLPKRNGQEVLQFIKNNPQLKHIPVIMLTTSSSEKDIVESYRNYANCYITKPVEADGFIDIIAQIERFWISTVKLSNEYLIKDGY